MVLNTNSKVQALISLIIVMFMSLLSLGLLSKFHEVMNTSAQQQLGLGLDLKEQYPNYVNSSITLIAFDIITFIVSVCCLVVILKPSKDNINQAVSWITLFGIIRFITSVIFLDNPNENFTEIMFILYDKAPRSNSNIEEYLVRWNQSYNNEIAAAIIIPIFQISTTIALSDYKE